MDVAHVSRRSAGTRSGTGVGLRAIPFGTGEAAGGRPPVPAPAPRAAQRRPALAISTALDDFVVVGTTGGYRNASEFLTFIHNAESGVKERGMFEGRGPLAILLLVFIGGLALNLTPCVLPMIPINLAIIGAGTQAGSRGRGFLLGGVYGAAMALVYGVLGLVVILTAGTFGTINASPWFNLGDRRAVRRARAGDVRRASRSISRASRATCASADSSRGTFVARVQHGRGGGAARRRVRRAGGHSGRAVLEQSLRDRHDSSRSALPFVLGVGMAVPWPIAGAGLAALPKPGAWMVRVKQAFGVFILATAAYYGYEAYEIFANRWVDPGAVASSVRGAS